MSQDQATQQFPPGYLQEYNGNSLFAVAIAFLVLENVCVALRFYARRIGNIAWAADDTLVIIGSVFCSAVCICTIANYYVGGAGFHEAALAMTDIGKIIIYVKFVLAISFLYLAAVLFPKLAILAIYLRVFPTKSYRITCWTLVGLLVAAWIGSTIAGLLTCVPLQYLWDKSITSGYCFNQNDFFRWSGLINIITDVVMLILPLPIIWRLQTPRNVKVGLTFTFATGSIGLITSIIRFAGFFTKDIEVDSTFSGTDFGIWAICETGTYLIAACLPAYRPLAMLLWKNGPLSSLLSRSKTTRPDQIFSKTGTQDIPLETRQTMGFERLDDEGTRSISAFSTENVEAHTEDEKRSLDQGKILVRHEFEVLSARPISNDDRV